MTRRGHVAVDSEDGQASLAGRNSQLSFCHEPTHVLLFAVSCRALQAGRREGDASIGRYLADTLAVVPHLDVADFERMFNEGVQDNLLLSYFAHLVRSQVALAERLGTQALPLL